MAADASVVGRTVTILWILAEADHGQTVSQVAQRAGLAQSTTHRILNQLRGLGMVLQTPDRRYHPGNDFVYMGSLVTGHLSAAIRPVLKEVVTRAQKESLLSIYLPSRVVRIQVASVDPRDSTPPRLNMAKQRDLLWGSTGRAILAHVEPDKIDRVMAMAQPSPASGQKPPSRPLLEQLLVRVRAAGYAYSAGEVMPHGAAVAVPIFSAQHQILGSLAVTERAERFDEHTQHQLARILREAAARMPALLAAHSRPAA